MSQWESKECRLKNQSINEWRKAQGQTISRWHRRVLLKWSILVLTAAYYYWCRFFHYVISILFDETYHTDSNLYDTILYNA
jgi:hypothetical protein